MRWIVAAVAATLLSLAPIVEGSRLTPPVLPLVVRNPYLSAWLGNARNEPWSKWPMFYTGESIGLSLMVHVPGDGNVYPLLGRPQDSLLPKRKKSGYNVSYPTYLGAKYDASTTNMTYSIPSPSKSGVGAAVAPVEITISFLSPITPTSTFRQSIPASYVTVHVEGGFNVNVYIDMNGQWVSGDRGARIEWEFDQINVDDDSDDVLKKWEVRRETEYLLTEHHDRSEWGSLHFTGPADVRHESGTSALLRKRFARTGTLQNVNDNDFRSIMNREPVFAFAKEFSLNKSSSATSDSVTFTIAHIQDPVVQFASARGLTMMKPLWESWFPNVNRLLTFHYSDFSKAAALATNYSSQLDRDAYRSGADDYVDIVALSARQVLGATTFSGTADNPILFLKEISSNGNFQTIDVIFPSFPFFLYTNPRWLAYLLEPLIEHMLSGQYPNTYAMHDLGTHFPNATGHPDGKDEYMPVEECGNIIIMGLALVNSLRYPLDGVASSVWSTEGLDADDALVDPGLFPLVELETRNGVDRLDTRWGGGKKGIKKARKWVRRTYSLWEQWTGYLVEFSLEPANQLSTDDFAGWLALQTNLALKGIIGINAMSELAALIGHDKEAKSYKNISDTYVSKWEGFGFSRDKTHAKVSYDWYGSWTTIYNLYADALLCFHLDGTDDAFTTLDGGQKPITPPKDSSTGFVPRHIYTKQSDWYHNVRQKYGLPLDSRHLYTKSDWEFFAMAVASKNTRQEILDSVALWVNETVTDRPLTDLYRTEGKGGFPGPTFFARPVVGGHFAFLALERACGGKAMDGLAFLDESDPPRADGEAASPSFGQNLQPGNFEL